MSATDFIHVLGIVLWLLSMWYVLTTVSPRALRDDGLQSSESVKDGDAVDLDSGNRVSPHAANGPANGVIVTPPTGEPALGGDSDGR